jgi:hypothetical protein
VNNKSSVRPGCTRRNQCFQRIAEFKGANPQERSRTHLAEKCDTVADFSRIRPKIRSRYKYMTFPKSTLWFIDLRPRVLHRKSTRSSSPNVSEQRPHVPHKIERCRSLPVNLKSRCPQYRSSGFCFSELTNAPMRIEIFRFSEETIHFETHHSDAGAIWNARSSTASVNCRPSSFRF